MTKQLSMAISIFLLFLLLPTYSAGEEIPFKETGWHHDFQRALDAKNFPEAALSLWPIAFSMNEAEAQYMLGKIYHEGLPGIRKDRVTSVRLLVMAARQGHLESQVYLGNYYFAKDIPMFDRDAAHFYRLAAHQGQPYALQMLGIMYGEGRGVEKDVILADALLQLARWEGGARSFLERAIKTEMSEKQKKQATKLAVECYQIDYKDCGF